MTSDTYHELAVRIDGPAQPNRVINNIFKAIEKVLRSEFSDPMTRPDWDFHGRLGGHDEAPDEPSVHVVLDRIAYEGASIVAIYAREADALEKRDELRAELTARGLAKIGIQYYEVEEWRVR